MACHAQWQRKTGWSKVAPPGCLSLLSHRIMRIRLAATRAAVPEQRSLRSLVVVDFKELAFNGLPAGRGGEARGEVVPPGGSIESVDVVTSRTISLNAFGP